MMSAVMAVVMSLSFVSCGDDDGDSDNGLVGWYCRKLKTAKDFTNDNESANEPWFHLYQYDDYFYSPWAEAHGDGEYIEAPSYSMNDYNNEFIHIENDNTLAYYYSGLRKYGSSDAQLLYQFNAGSNIGMLAYYGSSPEYYVYKKEGNTIVITKDDEKETFIITDGALLQNGGGKWTKYDPSKVY